MAAPPLWVWYAAGLVGLLLLVLVAKNLAEKKG